MKKNITSTAGAGNNSAARRYETVAMSGLNALFVLFSQNPFIGLKYVA